MEKKIWGKLELRIQVKKTHARKGETVEYKKMRAKTTNKISVSLLLQMWMCYRRVICLKLEFLL